MKITYEEKVVERTILVSDIVIGTVFGGILNYDSVYLRVFSGVVDLQNPCRDWPVGKTLSISLYRELDAELIVSPKEVDKE